MGTRGRRGWRLVELLAKCRDLVLDDVLEGRAVAVFPAGEDDEGGDADIHSAYRAGDENEWEHSQDFLQVREAEVVRLLGDILGQAVREIDGLVALELVLPVLDVKSAFVGVRVAKVAR